MSAKDDLINRIYNQKQYPEIKFPGQSFVRDVVDKYIYTVKKLSSDRGTSMYYNGISDAEKKQKVGNIFIKVVYMAYKGISSESDLQAHLKSSFDYKTRDYIWVILSLIMQNAKANPEYVPYWKPYDVIEAAKEKEKEVEEEPGETTDLMPKAAVYSTSMKESEPVYSDIPMRSTPVSYTPAPVKMGFSPVMIAAGIAAVVGLFIFMKGKKRS